MVDIQQQIQYWKDGSQEDIEVAGELISGGRCRHGLFFAHLAIEKFLKAVICKKTQSLAPRIHNLTRLSQIAELHLPQDQFDHLAEMNEFNLEGRYPVQFIDTVAQQEARIYLNKSIKVLEWLAQQL
jgi:HEPN domain-containing protein